MTPEQLLQTIYLGDRGCKSVLIDSWNQRVAIQVTVISRLKPGAKTWDFNTAADIVNGLLVFTDVRRIRFDPSGPIPNDFINHISVKEIDSAMGKPTYLFELSVGSVDNAGNSTEVLVEIEATGVHLEDPERPGVDVSDYR
jgi:hypothetical protein